MDNSSIHPASVNQAHHIELHLWRGAPRNLDEARPIQILVNQGYVVGFCPARLQAAWSAYRVACAEHDVDYKRPIHYHDDLRLPAEHRIGRKTFGKLGNVGIEVGHLTPNEVINRQFGRLAQMETFLMSNMSPQYGSLNRGVWLKLETAIREIKDEDGKDHVWAIVGPVFGDQSVMIERGSGKNVPVPEAYFCIIVDPHTYPYDRLSNVHVDCFIIPQDAPPASNPQAYPATLPEIEQRTKLSFFPGWGMDLPLAALEKAQAQASEGQPKSRLLEALDRNTQIWAAQQSAVEKAEPNADSIDGLVASLESEAAALQAVTRILSDAEQARLVTLQHTLSWMLAARQLTGSGETGNAEPARAANLITYKIVSDMDDRLKHAARIACNFWNRFIEPGYSVVIRLGIFTQIGSTIARAYRPYEKDGVRYGVVEFNTRYLIDYTVNETAGTIVHEIGHTLGFGWEAWDGLFDASTGSFSPAAITRLGLLEQMEVERDGGSGTALSHWDEQRFDKELMTGYKDRGGEHVLPVTIDVMTLLGHSVIERVEEQTSLDVLLDSVAHMVFSRQNEARELDLDHFEQTELFEMVPHQPA